MDPYDYVIVGGGTAGCVLANRLSTDPRNSVLLLEAGGKDDWIWIHIPVGLLRCIGNPRTDWCYKTEPDPGMNGRSILYPRGRVLGGSSSINAMLYLRGQARDYDEWARLTGDSGWSWASVLPVFKQSEDHWRGADAFHGAREAAGHAMGHEMRVDRQRVSWEILDAFRDAALESGIAEIEDFNRGDNAGCSHYDVNQRRGVRVNASKAFLRPAKTRKNLTVLTHAQVKRLRLDGRRVLGVEFFRDNEEVFAEARRETLLAAGSIGSPQILQLSGVGPGTLLQQHGLSVVHDLPGAGENLQDHMQVRMVFKIQNALTLNTLANSWWGKVKMGLEYALKRSGPLSMAPSQRGAFVKSDPSQPTPNLQYHVNAMSLDKFGDPLHTFPGFTASVCNLHPTSRGQVHIKSADPRAYPAIKLNSFSTSEDQRIAIQSLRLTRRIVTGTESMKKYSPEEYLPGARFQSDGELAQAAATLGTTIFHPVGTCKMGRVDDPLAVVDPQLRVRGIERLRVIDASVMPAITSGNTNAPVVMIAEKGARFVLKP
ncbi:MAG: GMC family oxidoreductase N-terminal domain-containing protein [Betaproteobacteria bacterium]|nr:GMC family oxidoreductase N-terminal domain-containing protein [Betaproteobacteria bacterium]